MISSHGWPELSPIACHRHQNNPTQYYFTIFTNLYATRMPSLAQG